MNASLIWMYMCLLGLPVMGKAKEVHLLGEHDTRTWMAVNYRISVDAEGRQTGLLISHMCMARPVALTLRQEQCDRYDIAGNLVSLEVRLPGDSLSLTAKRSQDGSHFICSVKQRDLVTEYLLPVPPETPVVGPAGELRLLATRGLLASTVRRYYTMRLVNGKPKYKYHLASLEDVSNQTLRWRISTTDRPPTTLVVGADGLPARIHIENVSAPMELVRVRKWPREIQGGIWKEALLGHAGPSPLADNALLALPEDVMKWAAELPGQRCTNGQLRLGDAIQPAKSNDSLLPAIQAVAAQYQASTERAPSLSGLTACQQLAKEMAARIGDELDTTIVFGLIYFPERNLWVGHTWVHIRGTQTLQLYLADPLFPDHPVTAYLSLHAWREYPSNSFWATLTDRFQAMPKTIRCSKSPSGKDTVILGGEL